MTRRGLRQPGSGAPPRVTIPGPLCDNASMEIGLCVLAVGFAMAAAALGVLLARARGARLAGAAQLSKAQAKRLGDLETVLTRR